MIMTTHDHFLFYCVCIVFIYKENLLLTLHFDPLQMLFIVIEINVRKDRQSTTSNADESYTISLQTTK